MGGELACGEDRLGVSLALSGTSYSEITSSAVAVKLSWSLISCQRIQTRTARVPGQLKMSERTLMKPSRIHHPRYTPVVHGRGAQIRRVIPHPSQPQLAQVVVVLTTIYPAERSHSSLLHVLW